MTFTPVFSYHKKSVFICYRLYCICSKTWSRVLLRICTHSKKLEHKNYVCNFQLSVFQEKLTKTDVNVNRARQMEQFIRSLLWDLVNSVSIYECFIGPFSFDISRRKCNKWYFVFKIVLTYCEKKSVLVIEKNFRRFDAEAENLQNL